MTECAVKDCSTTVETIFAPDLGEAYGTFEYGVCNFHFTALGEGEPWAEEPKSGRPVILMGTDLPPEVLNVKVSRTLGTTAVVTLVLGRDGIEEQEVNLRWSRDDVAELLEWMGGKR